MRYAKQVANHPLTFRGERTKTTRVGSPAYRGRVPVVLAFVGAHGPRADTAIVNLNASQRRFCDRRVRLLVVVDGSPLEVAERLSVTVPLIADDGLAADLGAEVDSGGLCAVIVGNHGHVLDIVRQLPAEDQASTVLESVDRLVATFPARFSTLPQLADDAVLVDDPSGHITGDTDAKFRQRLAWLTGDRKGGGQVTTIAGVAGVPAVRTHEAGRTDSP